MWGQAVKIQLNGTMVVCDACGRQKLVQEDDPMPDGVYGEVNVRENGAGYIEYEYYSCNVAESHIVQAMRKAESLAVAAEAAPDEYDRMKKELLSS